MQNSHNVIQLLSVNVATAAPLMVGGRTKPSAIGKRPVTGRVAVGLAGLAGDEQADRTVHGGPAKAVYAYPSEHHAFWRTVRAQAGVAGWDAPVAPGLLGENLTIAGVTEDRLWIGDQLHLPDAVLAVSEPRYPCDKFAAVMGFAAAVKLMVQSGYCGAYLGVIVPGTLAAGETARLVPGPRDVSVRELFRARTRQRG